MIFWLKCVWHFGWWVVCWFCNLNWTIVECFSGNWGLLAPLLSDSPWLTLTNNQCLGSIQKSTLKSSRVISNSTVKPTTKARDNSHKRSWSWDEKNITQQISNSQFKILIKFKWKNRWLFYFFLRTSRFMDCAIKELRGKFGQNFPFQTVKIFLFKLSKFSFSNCPKKLQSSPINPPTFRNIQTNCKFK